MPDRWERAHGLRVGANDARRDPDHDGLSNYYEYRIDRLPGLVSDPRVADGDHDGTRDGDEDLDHDGLSNEDEATLGTGCWTPTPTTASATAARTSTTMGWTTPSSWAPSTHRGDEDGDGVADGRDDDDHDRASNTREFNPRLADSDRDGVLDGREDEDHDGLDNAEEEQLGEDPSDADSDRDGVADGEETAGTIVAFDADSRVLTIQPLAGAPVVGTVAEDAELEWEETGDGPRACHDADGPTVNDLIPGRAVAELDVQDGAGWSITAITLVCPASRS